MENKTKTYRERLDEVRDSFRTDEEKRAFLDGVEWELNNQEFSNEDIMNRLDDILSKVEECKE